MFKPGQVVLFLHEKGEGRILRIEGDNCVILDDDGFERVFLTTELALKRGDLSDVDVCVLKDVDCSRARTSDKSKHVLSIDLHAHVLLDDESIHSPAAILRVQVTSFRKFLQQALERKVRDVLIIHGIGEGVLRNEVRTILNGIEGAEYWDEQFQHEGAGATRVRLRYRD